MNLKNVVGTVVGANSFAPTTATHRYELAEHSNSTTVFRMNGVRTRLWLSLLFAEENRVRSVAQAECRAKLLGNFSSHTPCSGYLIPVSSRTSGENSRSLSIHFSIKE
jgi:hypothetical protein